MIFVECNLDEYFIKSLGFSRRNVKHLANKGRVIRSLRKFDGNIGVVDEDPQSSQPKDLDNYVKISQTENLKLLQRNDESATHLIIISEYLEDWIVKRAIFNEINMEKYRLNPSARSLHTPHIEEKHNFQQFLKKLIEIDEEIKTLKTWLANYLS